MLSTFQELALFTFGAFCIVLFDIGVFSKSKDKFKALSTYSALKRLGFYVFVALLFGLWILYSRGFDDFIKFKTSYLLEVSLSVDNIFVFILIFEHFKTPLSGRYIVLFWGVVAAILLRGIFIFLGIAAIQKFHWMLSVFGIILVFTSIKILHACFVNKQEENDVSKSKLIKALSLLLPLTKEYDENKLYTKKHGKLYFTPLFLILAFIAIIDVVFAVDSIPAVFGVTTDSYIVYTSNILGILGLRSLFFIIQSFINKFYYLKFGLGMILFLIGLKLILSVFFGEFIGPLVMLLLVLAIIGSSIAVSIIFEKKHSH